MGTAATSIPWDELIEADRVHGSLYTDPAVYQAELERIWYGTWVYVGHESEIPAPGDYLVKAIGPQSVIMSRDRDGAIHLLLNRCSHRANQVCHNAGGNASTFRCPYHGWTFSNTGQLLGYSFSTGYEGRELKAGLGLGRVSRMDSYRGFVFGCFATEGPTLREYLGAATEVFDRLVRLSPEGEVAITAGWLRHRVKANWKMLLENETDGYHPHFVHASIFSVASSQVAELYSDQSLALGCDLGGGHTENDLRPELRRRDQPMYWFGTTADRVPGYVAAMEQAHGEAAREILVDGSPHVMIFPNLFLAEIQMFVLQPLALDETVQHVTAIQFKGAAELNRRILSQTIGSVGPAGFLLADDTEMYEANQRGHHPHPPQNHNHPKGLHREYVDEDGRVVAGITDEATLRGIWRHYRALMR